MVEYELPKLATGVRFPSLAPNLRSKFDTEAPLSNATNRSIVGTEVPLKLLLTILMVAMLAGCATVPYAPPSVTPMPKVHGTYHTVRHGETLWSISKMYSVDLNDLIRVNNLQESGSISRGQSLLIPGATRTVETPRYAYTRDSFAWPVRGYTVSSYGESVGNVRNKGIDIKSAEGSFVKASRAGRVVYCDQYLKGFGKTVILDHGDGYQTVYSYNSAILVNVGNAVRQNEAIARVGRTGRAKEPMLHFEIRKNGEPQNPAYYLTH